MSPSPQQNIDKKNPCPDSELLAAFSENRVDGFVLGAVAAHLIQCVDCAELHHRLLNLAKADFQADPAEWQKAEKRLDNWMNAYLRARPGQAEAEPQAEPQAEQRIATGAAGTVRNFYSWKIRWALGAVAALAVVAVTLFFLHRSLPSRNPQPDIAMQPSPSSVTPTLPAAPQESAQPAPERSSNLEPASPEQGTPPKVHNSITGPKSHAAPAVVASSDQKASRQEKPLEPSLNASNPQAASLETSATESADRNTNAFAEPPAGRAAVPSPGRNSSSDALQPSKTSMNAGKGFVPVAKYAPLPAADLPVLISLEYSTSMWIQLSSEAPPADGTFRFRGALLKPVDLPAGVPFDAKTRVDGLGAVSDGRISLLIKEFFFRGARYKLKTGRGAARVEPFNGGRTLEIWLDEDSVYERVPRG